MPGWAAFRVLVFAGLPAFWLSGTAHAGLIPLGEAISASSLLRVNDQTVDFQSENNIEDNTPTPSTAIVQGTPATITQVRTAARSSLGVMTVNATYEARGFGAQSTTFSTVQSVAHVNIAVKADSTGGAQEVFLDFFLPPGFLELVENAETGFDPATIHQATLAATISTCQNFPCIDVIENQFQFGATLTGNYVTQQLVVIAETTQSDLDTSPLESAQLQVTETTFPSGLPKRTALWEYPEFEGHVSLGILEPGDFLSVSYLMFATVDGIALLNGATAAINDPFLISGDPMLALRAVAVDGDVVAVAAPAGPTLFLSGLLILYGLRRRSRAG